MKRNFSERKAALGIYTGFSPVREVSFQEPLFLLHKNPFAKGKCGEILPVPVIATPPLSRYTSHMKHTHILSFFFFTAAFSMFAEALPFDSTLSEQDRSDLNAGKIVVRTIDKYKNMSVQSANAGVEKLRAEIKDLNPNYLAEVIQIKPYKGNEDLMQKFRTALEDIPDYAGIQYWSVQHERFYDLYSTATVVGKVQHDENTVQYNADLEMEPFGIIHTPIIIEETADYLLSYSTNNNTLKFDGKYNCVGKRNMKSAAVLFRDGDNWILYGVGGAKAFKIPMLEKRVATSLVNRIKTFYNFIYEKL